MKGVNKESVKNEMLDLNKKFHSKQLLSDSFYYQLKQTGFCYQQCLLITIFPDGGNTYCGKIIRQDGHVFAFDIDVDDSQYSSWEDITNETLKTEVNDYKSKHNLREVIAFLLFDELNK